MSPEPSVGSHLWSTTPCDGVPHDGRRAQLLALDLDGNS